MFYEVFIPSGNGEGYDVTITVEADNWMSALKSGLERTGQGADSIRNVMCDIKEDNTIHVTDASTARVFVLREVDDAALDATVDSADDEIASMKTQRMEPISPEMATTPDRTVDAATKPHDAKTTPNPVQRSHAPPPVAQPSSGVTLTGPPSAAPPVSRGGTPMHGTQAPPPNAAPPPSASSAVPVQNSNSGSTQPMQPPPATHRPPPSTAVPTNAAPPPAAQAPPSAAVPSQAPPPAAARQAPPANLHATQAPQQQAAQQPPPQAAAPAPQPQPEEDYGFGPMDVHEPASGLEEHSYTSDDGRMRIGSATFEALKREQVEPEPKVIRETRAPSGQHTAVPIGRPPSEAVSTSALEEVFLEINQIHEGSMSMEQVINFVMDLSMSKIRAEAGSIMFADVNGKELYFATARGPKASEVMDFRVPMSKGLVGFCAREGVSLAISDAEKDPRFYAEISEKLGYDTKNLICAPVQFEGRVYGAIELMNKSTPFDNTEVRVLTYIGRQLAKFVNDLIMAREKI